MKFHQSSTVPNLIYGKQSSKIALGVYDTGWGIFSGGISQREKLYIISRFVFAEMQSGLIIPVASSDCEPLLLRTYG